MSYRDYHSGIDGTCLNCENRYPACHDSCEKYLTAKAKFEEQKKIIKTAKEEFLAVDAFKRDVISKTKKRGRNQGKSYTHINYKR